MRARVFSKYERRSTCWVTQQFRVRKTRRRNGIHSRAFFFPLPRFLETRFSAQHSRLETRKWTRDGRPLNNIHTILEKKTRFVYGIVIIQTRQRQRVFAALILFHNIVIVYLFLFIYFCLLLRSRNNVGLKTKTITIRNLNSIFVFLSCPKIYPWLFSRTSRFDFNITHEIRVFNYYQRDSLRLGENRLVWVFPIAQNEAKPRYIFIARLRFHRTSPAENEYIVTLSRVDWKCTKTVFVFFFFEREQRRIKEKKQSNSNRN